MNSKMIVKKFIHDLEQGWDSDFYKQNEDGELEFAATPEEVAVAWVFAQYGNSSTADFANEVLAEHRDEWESYI